MAELELRKPFRVLSLDGGGSLGVYSLGVLVEIERMLGKRIHEAIDLVYGTSTGSIIGSMIAHWVRTSRPLTGATLTSHRT